MVIQRARVDHAAVAAAARAVPGRWTFAGLYTSLKGADGAARRVAFADRMPSYQPAGGFEAYAVTCVDGPVVWVRSTEGGPYPRLPERMTVRIPAVVGLDHREAGTLTVSVRPFCPVCGGPRGWEHVHPAEVRFRNVSVTADRWSNPCGHVDVYADVLEESRRTPAVVGQSAARFLTVEGAARRTSPRFVRQEAHA